MKERGSRKRLPLRKNATHSETYGLVTTGRTRGRSSTRTLFCSHAGLRAYPARRVCFWRGLRTMSHIGRCNGAGSSTSFSRENPYFS